MLQCQGLSCSVNQKLAQEITLVKNKVLAIEYMSNKQEAYENILHLQVLLDKALLDVDNTDIWTIQMLVRKGKLSYKKLVEIFLHRIYYYNDVGIGINAIRAVNEFALEEAEKCDEAIAKNKELAQGLFGIPILVKDNIETESALGLPTTAGSIAFAKNYAEQDAVFLAQLCQQGAIILAKTNLSEFANFITNGVKRADGTVESMPSGYSSLGGQVLCPYKPGVINPAGSSSGSGAGCAAAMAAVAIGTETSGSILNPATANSLVGIKPTVGLISRRGIIPLSHSQDTAGPMARNVSDAAVLLEAMKCFDALDMPVTAGENNALVTEQYWQSHTSDYTKALRKDGLQGMRLGIYVKPSEADMLNLWQNTLQRLQELGAVLVYSEKGEALDYIVKNNATELPWVSELLHLDFASDMQRARQVQLEEIAWSRTATVDKLFQQYNLDALISFNGGTTRIAAKAGYPSITVPAGYRDVAHDQYPVNLQFTGQAFSEFKLIGMAYAFEQATKARKAPGMANKKKLQEAIDEAKE
ncbi:MAG: amidase family protein, partial [Phascolarctobacterium sp.]